MLQNIKNRIERLLQLSPLRLLLITAVAAIVAAIVVLSSFQALTSGTQIYRDIVVGEITISDSYKHGDLLFSFLAVACFFICWFVTAYCVSFFDGPVETSLSDNECGFEPQALFIWGICSFIAGVLFCHSGISLLESSFPLLLVAVYGFMRYAGHGSENDSPSTITIIWGVAVWGIFFSVIGILALAEFFIPQTVAAYENLLGMVPLYAAGLGGVVLLVVASSSALYLRRIAVWCQVLIPLTLLSFFTRVMAHNGVVTENLLSLPTKIIGLLVVCAGVISTLWAVKRQKTINQGESFILTPAVVSAAASLAYTTLQIKEIDLFHTGEMLLAWQQIFEKGLFPYTGFAWARGFGDAFPGLLNTVLFDGTFATFDTAFNMPGMIIAGLSAFMLCRVLGPVWGLVLATLGAQTGIFKWWLYLPILLVLVDPALLRRPLRWLCFWLVLSVTHCLYQATTGIALMLGTLPIAGWMLLVSVNRGDFTDAWRLHKKTFLISIILLAGFLVVAVPLMIGFVTYIHDQGTVNEIANGSILRRPMQVAEWFRWKSQLSWEFYRVGGWMIGIVFLWHFLVREHLKEKLSNMLKLPDPVTVIGIVGISSLIVFIPYSMGRIDSRGLSRTGSLSLFALGILLPIMFKLSQRKWGKVEVVLCGILLGVTLAPGAIDPLLVAKRTVAPAQVSTDAIWFDGPRNGLQKIGGIYVPASQLGTITTVKLLVDRLVKPDETFYDLTNSLALYNFLDKKVMSLYAGYYIVTSEGLQNKVIATLEKAPPPLVVAAPAREFGSGTASLRSYRIYRWFIQRGYIPVVYNGLGFLVRPDRFSLLWQPVPSDTVITETLGAIFSSDTIGFVPVAWGRSIGTLMERFDGINIAQPGVVMSTGSRFVSEFGSEVVVTKADVSLVQAVDGGVADFLSLILNSESQSDKLPVRIQWPIAGTGNNELNFYAVPGVPLLVPVGSHPGWLRDHAISRFSIEIAGATATIGKLEFLHLKK